MVSRRKARMYAEQVVQNENEIEITLIDVRRLLELNRQIVFLCLIVFGVLIPMYIFLYFKLMNLKDEVDELGM